MTGLVSQTSLPCSRSQEGGEDYSKIFQATVGSHPTLMETFMMSYTSGMRDSNQMMLMGDYVKYVDDFRECDQRWKSSMGVSALMLDSPKFILFLRH